MTTLTLPRTIRLPVISVALVGLVTLLVLEVVVRLPTHGAVWIGHDYRTYMDAARDWLATGQFYEPYQLAGPYPVMEREILYPPVILALLVPFTFLPAVLWWAVPIGITTWVVWLWHPTRIGWIAVLALLTLPISEGTSWAVEFVGNGNPGMWVAAIVALATRWPVFGSLALLKPTLAPFALVGIRSRAWWTGAFTFVAVSALFGSMWFDYATVLSHARTEMPSLLYSLPNVTLALVPLAAYAFRRASPARG